jgi:hypothetical protein
VRRGALLHRCAAGRVPKQVYRLPPQLAPDARRWMRGKLLSDVP